MIEKIIHSVELIRLLAIVRLPGAGQELQFGEESRERGLLG